MLGYLRSFSVSHVFSFFFRSSSVRSMAKRRDYRKKVKQYHFVFNNPTITGDALQEILEPQTSYGVFQLEDAGTPHFQGMCFVRILFPTFRFRCFQGPETSKYSGELGEEVSLGGDDNNNV